MVSVHHNGAQTDRHQYDYVQSVLFDTQSLKDSCELWPDIWYSKDRSIWHTSNGTFVVTVGTSDTMYILLWYLFRYTNVSDRIVVHYVFFQRCIDYIDIAEPSYAGVDNRNTVGESGDFQPLSAIVGLSCER